MNQQAATFTARSPQWPVIGIDANGGIYTGTGSAYQVLDTRTEDRLVPLLSSHLDLYATATRGANEVPLVQIHVHDGAMQQRVMDVLNALAKKEIHAVTFTDLIGM